MQIEHLELQTFRRVESAQLDLAPGANLFVGENAQGKTTVLEALSFLARGRSFRSTRDRDCIPNPWTRDGQVPMACAEARFMARGARHELRTAITHDKKSLWLDGKPIRGLASLWGTLPVVTFIPEDQQLVRGAPTLRRSLLDALVAQVSQADLNAMQDYAAALKNRNALLRMGRNVPAQLAPWESAMARHGKQLVLARMRIVKLLEPLVAAHLLHLAAGTDELRLRVEHGWPRNTVIPEEIPTDPVDEKKLQEALQQWWEQQRTHDLERGSTQHGPHRGDLAMILNGRDARAFASQGQSRSIVLALRLAEREIIHQETGEPPILLLDDVLGELDRRRARHFVRLLSQRGVQSLLTATDASIIEEELPIAARFSVRDGKVIRMSSSA